MESVCTFNVGLRMRMYNISKFAATFRDDVKLLNDRSGISLQCWRL